MNQRDGSDLATSTKQHCPVQPGLLDPLRTGLCG